MGESVGDTVTELWMRAIIMELEVIVDERRVMVGRDL